MKITISNEIPKNANQIHLYNVYDVLRPRGHMKKESIGVSVKEDLESAFNSWTDNKYSDRVDPKLCLDILLKNLEEEINGAFHSFVKSVEKEHPEEVKEFLSGVLQDINLSR